jgi:hypothetical protein
VREKTKRSEKNYTPKSKTTKREIYTIFSIQNPYSISKTSKIIIMKKKKERKKKQKKKRRGT